MPRTANRSNYHYEVFYQNDMGDIIKKYFRTTKEISETFKICRATIYNLKTNQSRSRDTKIYRINKLEKPIPVYIQVQRPTEEMILI
jgi:hypothetical protein